MKPIQSKPLVSRLATLAAVLAAGGALVLPETADANTAANTTVRNTVTVNYADAGATAQPAISDEVDVTVQLVAATPSISIPTDPAQTPGDQTIAPSSTATYSYALFSNANGPDTYTLSVASSVNAGGVTASSNSVAPGSLTLGATTVISYVNPVGLTYVLTVPSDQSAPLSPDNIVNGIASGEDVVVSGVRCDVTAVGDSGTEATGAITNSTISVTCDSAIAPALGTVVGEMQTFSLTADPTGWTAPGPGTITVTVSAVDSAPSAAPATTDVTVTTVEQLLSVTKFVRNVTSPAAGAGTTASDGTSTFYESGIVGAPGNRLEYLVVVTNTSTSNNATDVVISDPVPAFTTFTNAGACLNSLAVINNAGTVTTVMDTENNDAGEVQSNTIYLYPGGVTHGDDTDGGTGNSNGDGGTLAPGQVAKGRFCVSID